MSIPQVPSPLSQILTAKTYNAAWFAQTGDTNAQTVQRAIDAGAADNTLVAGTCQAIFVPANLLPYDANVVVFNTAIKMIREGGDWSVFDVYAYGAQGNGSTNDIPAFVAANAGAAVDGGVVYATNKDFLVSSSIILSSGVTLYLATGARIIRGFAGGGATNATVRNADLVNGNTDIALLGDGAILTITPTFTGKHIGFTRVTRFKMQGISFLGVYGDWNIGINVTDALISDLNIISGSAVTEDGLHIVGGQRIVVENIVVDCGDDCISLWSDIDGNEDDIKDVTINNVVCRTAKSNCIRVGVPAAAVKVVERISINNVVGIAGISSNGNGIRLADTTATGLVRDVTISNVTLDCSSNGGSGADIDDVVRVMLRNVALIQPNSRIDIDGITDLTLENCRVRNPRGANIQCILAAAAKACTNLRIIGGHYTTATTHAIELGTASFAVTDGEIIGAVIESATNAGIRLRNISGCLVQANRIKGCGAQAIIEVAPSDNNTIVENDCRGNASGVTTVGAATVRRGNKATTGAMQGRAVLVAGTLVVNTAEVVASDNIVLSKVVKAGTDGFVEVSAIVAATSFTILSSNAADTGTVFWELVH